MSEFMGESLGKFVGEFVGEPLGESVGELEGESVDLCVCERPSAFFNPPRTGGVHIWTFFSVAG